MDRKIFESLRLAQQNSDTSQVVRCIYYIGPAARCELWRCSFFWALSAQTVTQADYERWSRAEISTTDSEQIDRDVPRTENWLRHAVRSEEPWRASPERLAALRRILRAYVASQGWSTEDDDAAYVQGMNGVAILLLEVFEGDEVRSLCYLKAIAEALLPTIFGTEQNDALGDNQASRTFVMYDEMLQSAYPETAAILSEAGLSPGSLATKWLFTLFTNISLSGNKDDALPLPTVLAAWDVCFALGMAGVSAVVLALFRLGGAGLKALKLSMDDGEPMVMEDCVGALRRTLRFHTAARLLNDVADVFTEAHPKLKSQLQAQRRRIIRSSGAPKPDPLLFSEEVVDSSEDRMAKAARSSTERRRGSKAGLSPSLKNSCSFDSDLGGDNPEFTRASAAICRATSASAARRQSERLSAEEAWQQDDVRPSHLKRSTTKRRPASATTQRNLPSM